MRLSSRRRCDIKSINYPSFPKDFFDECEVVSQNSNKKINQLSLSSKECQMLEQPNVSIKINVGRKGANQDLNSRYLCIKDTNSSKFRI